MSNITGILLINLGTPSAPTVSAVGAYLRQFLNDPRVIELPWALRWALVNLFIVPTRAKQSSRAYRAIWQGGSPLLINSRNMQQELQQSLGDKYRVALGMRYGKPSIDEGLAELSGANVTRLLIIPLFPQYSSAANGSALEYVLRTISRQKVILPLLVVNDFHAHPAYIDAQAQVIKPYLDHDYDFVLFSFHGLPQRQLIKSSIACYKTKCLESAHSLASNLALAAKKWQVSFQSRLGRLPWIEPYTDKVLQELRECGVRRLLIVCPSFVADCLETLEEIGIRAREQWLNLGGEDLTLVPSMNDNHNWINALKTIIHDNLPYH